MKDVFEDRLDTMSVLYGVLFVTANSQYYCMMQSFGRIFISENNTAEPK